MGTLFSEVKVIREGKLNKNGILYLMKRTNAPTKSYLLGKHLPLDKDMFNYYLLLHRQVIERAFGLMVARWESFGEHSSFHRPRLNS